MILLQRQVSLPILTVLFYFRSSPIEGVVHEYGSILSIDGVILSVGNALLRDFFLLANRAVLPRGLSSPIDSTVHNYDSLPAADVAVHTFVSLRHR